MRPSPRVLERTLLALAITGFGIVLLRTAWLCDDAYISYRTVSNFVDGYGLRWNLDERVQAYTHPLWLFVNIAVHIVTREVFVSGIALCIVASMTAVTITAFRLAGAWFHAMLAVVLLTCSRAFVDYSTSGLENPLTHLLLAVFLVVFFKDEWTPRKVLALAMVASLGVLNRLDAALLYLPALFYGWWRVPTARSALLGLLGFLPLLAWEAFSLIYYGFLLPNTAYAKLGTGIDRLRLVEQGFRYLQDCFQRDAITVVVLGAALVAVCLRKRTAEAAVVAGAILYLAYVVFIGGDFMSGRFFSAPYFLAVVVFVRLGLERPALQATVFPAVFALCLIQPYAPMLTGARYGLDGSEAIGPHFIVDERRGWYRSMSLLKFLRGAKIPDHPYADEGLRDRQQHRRLVQHGSVGLRGYYAGPQVHILDYYGLTDPFLARLPAIHQPSLRIGHFERHRPAGYHKTLDTGRNTLEDADLGRFFEELEAITRAALWNRERWKAIVGMHLGRFDHLVDEDAARFPRQKRVLSENVAVPKPAGAEWSTAGATTFGNTGLRVMLGRLEHGKSLVMSLDGNDEYRITLLHEAEGIHRFRVGPTNPAGGGLAIYTIDVPSSVARRGYSEVRIVPYGGDGHYSLGHLTN